MFIKASFTIAKLWKQPKYSTTDECIKKLWYLYTMKFYSATKKKEILSFAGKWMELENIILSEVNQVQKAKKLNFFSFMSNIHLIQIQQYYEKQVTHEGRWYRRGRG
jgi:hypothetical protein